VKKLRFLFSLIINFSIFEVFRRGEYFSCISNLSIFLKVNLYFLIEKCTISHFFLYIIQFTLTLTLTRKEFSIFFIPSYKIKNLAHLSHLNRVKKPLCYFQILKNKEKKLIKLISSALKFPFPI